MMAANNRWVLLRAVVAVIISMGLIKGLLAAVGDEDINGDRAGSIQNDYVYKRWLAELNEQLAYHKTWQKQLAEQCDNWDGNVSHPLSLSGLKSLKRQHQNECERLERELELLVELRDKDPSPARVEEILKSFWTSKTKIGPKGKPADAILIDFSGKGSSKADCNYVDIFSLYERYQRLNSFPSVKNYAKHSCEQLERYCEANHFAFYQAFVQIKKLSVNSKVPKEQVKDTLDLIKDKENFKINGWTVQAILDRASTIATSGLKVDDCRKNNFERRYFVFNGHGVDGARFVHFNVAKLHEEPLKQLVSFCLEHIGELTPREQAYINRLGDMFQLTTDQE